VGVIAVHYDMSGMYSQMGVKPTVLIAGKKKADGSPYAPLSEAATADLMAELDRLRGLFATSVANDREMSVDAVLATEAGVFTADAAIGVGFAALLVAWWSS
jgi:ClpP class serine protease